MTSQGRVFAVPPAGAGASFYRQFTSPELRLLGLCLPGREARHRERLLTTVEECALDIAGQVTRVIEDEGGPVSLLGHSFGALVAWRAALILQTRGVPVSALFISGAAAPGRSRPRISHLSDVPLLERLAEVTGSPHEALNIAELRPLVMPALRADLEASGNARYEVEATGPPMMCLGGLDDPVLRYGGLERWADFTDCHASVRWFPGGHMFLRDNPQAFMAALLESPVLERQVGLHPEAGPTLVRATT